MDYPADQVITLFVDLGITHVVWLPDSALGPWEQALAGSDQLQLVRVCREGEAWAIAAGLYLGGKLPLVVIQNTGFFESGDAMRNVLFDLRLPLLAIVGYRSYLVHGSTDSARRFTEPIINAWGLQHVLVTRPDELAKMADFFRERLERHEAGVALIAEGRM
jgi:sulfopyruvate decarboxylase TPP-binding subunit